MGFRKPCAGNPPGVGRGVGRGGGIKATIYFWPLVVTILCLETFSSYLAISHIWRPCMKYSSTLNMLFRIQIRYDNVCRNSNSFVICYLFWLLSKIGHFQVCWLIQDVRGSRAQVKWLAVIVSLENDIFGIAYTSLSDPANQIQIDI